MAIEESPPRLSWELRSNEHDIHQTVYQIIVASSTGQLATNEGDLWDSGKIPSRKTIQIRYEGRQLAS